ncbi:deoxyguanosinetriphosphate triphosphohydrolase family protein [Parashewanella spongiae]|uniref:Deoxyguanosinetriphosphate triphosphohydrolase-like protein n=1 Tax=Parashewanella spongiae TaxID=342950 RepID=A0A3A6TG20_9GAMM|nr:anti-phage deoxyguanosine triphosphatase [Parashewanella spongiae]MCL1079550.1 deoxyguanosinetriphosphate triphosphohydrolase family protein [Parashewanella spongiae]RJY07376.1 deoxyguanosinetriphosphate triphosphohydrolase family protein [Parashewanella spongiae]
MLDQLWQARRSSEDKHRRDDHRSPYQRDRARILHSAAFRRLQAKTQVLGVGMNDFYRTRLTHSLEVSQIGTGILAQLNQRNPELSELLNSDSLIESMCLAHDIGHPPFGHGGETALNYMMRNDGGFEGNGQTFRILSLLEPYTSEWGMNLTRRTLLGILKYPVTYSQLFKPYSQSQVANYRQLKPSHWPVVKGVFDDDKNILHWVIAPLSSNDKALFLSGEQVDTYHHKRSKYKSLDCSIMELADDIAYAVHDLEDAIVMGIVTKEQWQETIETELNVIKNEWITNEVLNLDSALFSPQHHVRKNAIGTLVNTLVTAIHITENTIFDEPLLRFNAVLEPEFDRVLETLKQFVYKRVIRRPEIQMLEFKGQQIVMELFEAFASDPERLLPYSTQERWKQAITQGENGLRVICDYISGMTDDFAGKLYQQLFSPKTEGIIDFGPQ